MELSQLIQICKKWAWLIVLGLVFGGIAGYYATKIQAPVYEATTKILVTRNPQGANSDYAYLSDQQLLQTFLELLVTQPVINGASEQVNFTIDPENVTVKQVRETQIIQVTVTDNDPQRAAKIANALVTVLIAHNENLQADKYAATEKSLELQIDQVEKQLTSLRTEFDQINQQEIQNQLTQVNKQIADLDEEIASLQKDIAWLNPPRTADQRVELSEKQARLTQIEPLFIYYQQILSNLNLIGKPVISGSLPEDSRTTQLQSTLTLYQQLYASLLNNLESIRLLRLQYKPNIAQIDEATVPLTPVRPIPVLYAVLAGVMGLILSGAVIFIVEYSDKTLKVPEYLQSIGSPIIGAIPNVRQRSDEIPVLSNPNSPTSDAFRMLRCNLDLPDSSKPLKTLLVVSPGSNDGKTTVAVNLAASFALLGKCVLLVDGNARTPRLHRFAGVDNSQGLSEILTKKNKIPNSIQKLDSIEGLNFIPSGESASNLTELLESDDFPKTLAQLSAKADLLIVDGPSTSLPDAWAIASHVDGVLLVVRPDHTNNDSIRTTVEHFRRVGTNLSGIVVNCAPKNWSRYAG